MARLRKKFRHRWLKETIQISDDRVLPGMVATFYYSAPKIFDRNPNCLVTHVDDKFIYGFNLNYVQSNTFTDIIRRLITVVPVALENNVQASKPYVRLQMASKFSPSAFGGKLLYERLKVNQRVRDVYRTYRKDKASALQVVNVDYEQFGFQITNLIEE